MDEQNNAVLASSAERLAAAADVLEKILARIESSQAALHAKVDRIIAAIEENTSREHEQESPATGESSDSDVAASAQAQLAELQRENAELKAQAGRLSRKTLSPLVSGLLAKSGMEAAASVEQDVLEKALATLSLEQRIAVKAELARAGMIG